MRRPQAILFDLGNTILREVAFNYQAWGKKISEFATLPEGVDLTDVYASGAGLHEEILGHHHRKVIEFPLQSSMRLLHDRFGITSALSDNQLELEFWRTTAELVPETGIADVLSELRSAGLHLGVLSNSMFSGDVLRWELERHGLASHFRFIMSSADYGFRKPHPSIFATAVGKLGVPPDDVWFVGNSIENDVAGATHAGLTPVWYNRGGARSFGNPKERTEIHHWNEFVELLPGSE